ncbi:hypothetical protein L1987_54628 [Smallanthus sonchifolius]|uniref:Uncharacterized protein n=1 Tax=Smallanthus sonchifolius TaxID=185202 RepID=A0ACB9E7Q3_9ASTR|nr:hypothetical protein L1987_54628 [Smallanthus sonchifolius]
MKSLIHRWSFIQKATNKFFAKLAQVEGLNQSGMTDHDKANRGNYPSQKMKFTLLEESRAQEKEFYRLKAEKMEYDKDKEQNKICQEDERLRLEAKKLELAKKESDQRIMMMDVSVMPEMKRLYFEELQREIMITRSHACENQL